MFFCRFQLCKEQQKTTNNKTIQDYNCLLSNCHIPNLIKCHFSSFIFHLLFHIFIIFALRLADKIKIERLLIGCYYHSLLSSMVLFCRAVINSKHWAIDNFKIDNRWLNAVNCIRNKLQEQRIDNDLHTRLSHELNCSKFTITTPAIFSHAIR